MNTIIRISQSNNKTLSRKVRLSDHELSVLIDYLQDNTPQKEIVAYILVDTSDVDDPKATYLYRKEPVQDAKEYVPNPVTQPPKVYNETLNLNRAEHWKVKSPFANQ